jgi:uncharacterized protein (DUF58 family)
MAPVRVGGGFGSVNRWLFRRVLGLDRWTRARFTPLGRLLLGALIAVGLFALNPRATLAYQLALVLLAIIVAAMLWAPLFRSRLRARRLLPRFATVGAPVAYTLEVRNLGRRTLRAVELCDEVRVPRADPARLRAADAGGRRGGWFDRRMGYTRFVHALRVLEGARCHASRLPVLAPGSAARVSMELEPLRRGYVTLDTLRVARPDPTGVFRALRRLPLPDRLLVLPRRYPVSWDGGGASQQRPRDGGSRSQAGGGGADFARLREYRPKDSLRHIHWRAWARLGEPVVKEFFDESPSRNALVLDTAAGDDCTPAAFEEAVSVAASFVADAGWRSGRLDLLVAGDEAVHLGQGNEGEGVGRMLEVLACVERCASSTITPLAETVQRRLGGFGACVLVLLDWDPPRQALARSAQAAGVSTLVLVVAEQAPQRLRASADPIDPARVHAIVPGDAARVLASLSAPDGSTQAPLGHAVAARG